MSSAQDLNAQEHTGSTPITTSGRDQQATGRGGTPPWWIVAKREMNVKVRDKAFIVGTLSSLVLVAVAIFLSIILGPKDSDTFKLVISDAKSAELTQVIEQLAQADDLKLEVQQVESADAAKQLLREEDADAYLTNEGGGWQVWSLKESNSKFVGFVTDAANTKVINDLAAASGADLQTVNQQLQVSTQVLDPPNQDKFVGMMVSLAFALIFMMVAMIFGMQIATSVIEEKQSRIVEILVSAIPVRHLLLGKILGISIIAFVQVLVILAAALIGLRFTPFGSLVPDFLSASAWFIVFFIAGFMALATLWAAAGALGTRPEDLNQSTAPLTFILMIAYVFGFSATGTVRVIASYVPIVSAILMPARIAEGGVSWWEPLLALVLNVAFAAVTIYFGAKIYRRALLQTSGRLSYRQAIQLAE